MILWRKNDWNGLRMMVIGNEGDLRSIISAWNQIHLLLVCICPLFLHSGPENLQKSTILDSDGGSRSILRHDCLYPSFLHWYERYRWLCNTKWPIPLFLWSCSRAFRPGNAQDLAVFVWNRGIRLIFQAQCLCILFFYSSACTSKVSEMYNDTFHDFSAPAAPVFLTRKFHELGPWLKNFPFFSTNSKNF